MPTNQPHIPSHSSFLPEVPLGKYRSERALRLESLQEDGVEEKFEEMLSASSGELGAAAVKHAKDFP